MYQSTYFAGDIGDVLIYNRALSGAERDAVNGYLNSKFAVVPNAPVAPTNLTASAVSPTQITGVGGTYSQVAVVQDATSYLDTSLTANTTYYYRVKGSNFAGDSGYSNEAGATTASGGADLPLSDLSLWLKADTAVTRQSTNNGVQYWFDQSGAHNDASQGTAANQPQWLDNVMNGRPVVRFDANSRYFSLPNLLNGATQAEAFVVLKATADTPTAARAVEPWQL